MREVLMDGRAERRLHVPVMFDADARGAVAASGTRGGRAVTPCNLDVRRFYAGSTLVAVTQVGVYEDFDGSHVLRCDTPGRRD